MKRLALAAGIFSCLFSFGQNNIAIIPAPVSMVAGAGNFTLPRNIIIEAPFDAGLKQVTAVLKERLSVPTGNKVTMGKANATIRLALTGDAKMGKEGYALSVTTKNITIKANQPAGLFYGVQTLLQLFPKEIESAKLVSGVKWTAPVVEINDSPRFGWRGLMFDVARHFFTKAEVKQFIDDMVRYKYNLLHLHLTDDEGWRIEIKGLPKLTEVGAWNVKKTGYFGTFSPPAADEPKDYGGFYTQDDIREIVQYAKERFVNILPEIDVPGHSLAAVASYPELSCTPAANTYRVRSGEVIMDWSRGAPPIALVDNTLCPANEKVYDFLDKVMTQVAQLFPFEYIHVGGDECPKNFWEKNDQIKALMVRENLKSMEEVQSYFEKRLEKIVESKGKKFLGWDEILEGGLAPSAAVMSWRGVKGGIEAAKMKHEVVMSPTTYAYLDYMQGDVVMEPRIYASLRLKKTYEFDPLPEGVDKQYIKGGQANLWSEQIYNMRHAQYMLWPRAFAIAESVWSPKEKKNWNNFFSRVEKHFERYDVAEKKYAPSVYEPAFSISKGADSLYHIALNKEVDAVDLYYSFDNSFPDRFYPKYTDKPITMPKDAVNLRVASYIGNRQVGRIVTMPVAEMQARTRVVVKK
ncbi:family 20 glycosylhydrolase [Sediminibacterium roseum]|uniref:beta-N-acetylhexosaminidase n=1 Tax=Sediminibacterium roseum TaxID=1978412 RepID=A0ABX0A0F9_9BACT|nr:beta-N-acetylhexosaminidase [Sediminibacterium roseum]NCI50735.1 family 20 glycosylhydrolase [Sediminibacterium roseum]